MKPLAKLLSAWFGPKPPWYGRFVEQLRGFRSVDWELVPPPDVTERDGPRWMDDQIWKRLAVYGKKRHGNGPQTFCDYRPAYGELFADCYAGYEWWGWCDLDICFGRLDHWLPLLLTGDYDALSLKQHYLSGCFALFRNTPEITGLFRKGPWKEVFGDPRYYCWDESGLGRPEDTSFYKLLGAEGLRVNTRPDLYGYDSPLEDCPVARGPGGDLYDPLTGEEKLLFHFMSDRWPEVEARE